MSEAVEEVALHKFERLIKFFKWCILLLNFGYRKGKARFYNYFFPLLFLISTCFNVKHVVLTYNSTNRIQATYTIVFIAVHIQSFGKALMMVINYQDFEELFQELKKFYTSTEHQLITDARNRHNATHIRGITYGVVSYWISFWFAEIFLQAFIRRLGGIEFPMQYYIPFISEDSPYFFIVNFLMQNFTFIASLTVMSLTDVMVFMVAFQFRSELVCLAEVISKLDDIEVYKAREGILLDIYRMHHNMLHLFNVLSNMFFYMSFFQVVSSFEGLCFLFYAFFVHGFDISSPIIIFVVFCQIFIFCLFGEILFTKTAALSNALYHTKWYEFTPHDKRDFVFILQNAQRPCSIKAAGIVDVSIYTFVEVLKLSGSYCAIFYALTNKK
ncbi:putative odorant receptor 83c [Phlebotomus argentipes]|uniref:putative odorant receptor 83c n=1 Tax=Phlebotomus argentipes TaxID=94469 RepID=UPI00289328F9|nr:putative odorant receptor 83c [Phlebotomus argentipes]